MLEVESMVNSSKILTGVKPHCACCGKEVCREPGKANCSGFKANDDEPFAICDACMGRAFVGLASGHALAFKDCPEMKIFLGGLGALTAEIAKGKGRYKKGLSEEEERDLGKSISALFMELRILAIAVGEESTRLVADIIAAGQEEN